MAASASAWRCVSLWGYGSAARSAYRVQELNPAPLPPPENEVSTTFGDTGVDPRYETGCDREEVHRAAVVVAMEDSAQVGGGGEAQPHIGSRGSHC